jgi:hypothetical protein
MLLQPDVEMLPMLISLNVDGTLKIKDSQLCKKRFVNTAQS